MTSRALLPLLILGACAHNVPQDLATGEDGRIKGAKPVALDDGEGKATGIVTYPGGDRVDWKMIEIPEGQRGDLDVKLSWNPPRPGLQLAFDVFDQYNTPVATSKRTTRRHSTRRVKTASVEKAHGKYFVRVYAVDRGDAGKYKLAVDFHAYPKINETNNDVAISDPPALAAIPDPPVDCSANPRDPSCKNTCAVPDASNPACWATMACPPGPPNPDIASCRSRFAPCDPKNIDYANPNCKGVTAPPPPRPQSITARIVKNEVMDGRTVITISGVGKDFGVDRKWVGRLTRTGDSVQIIDVRKREIIARVKLGIADLQPNEQVVFDPPPP